MRRLPRHTPGWFMLVLPGLLCGLSGCATTNGGESSASSAPSGAAAGSAGENPSALSFEVEVISSHRSISRLLRQHLDIQRFRGFTDLQANELRRLMGEVESNARDLLAAEGFFQPSLSVRMEEPEEPGSPRRIVIEAEPGKPTQVTGYQIEFAEPMNSDPSAARQRATIQEEWPLKEGREFTQEAWDSAKSVGLRALQRHRYPTARIADSRATVYEQTLSASLEITYAAGPPYRFGTLRLEGLERYDAEGIRNIARLPTGTDYSESALLDAQQRLASSGYFDSAFLTLDPEEKDPESATVIAQLREAKNQKAVYGLGYSTDSGLRTSLDHFHNQMWPLGWRAVNRVELGTQTQKLSTNWTAMPGQRGWAWYTGAFLERSDYGDYRANSISLTAGRTKSSEHIERRYYLQYDYSRTDGSDSPGSSSSILGNYAWIGRYFDDRLNPARGYGLAAEAGLGYTLTPEEKPFLRFTLNGLRLLPIGERNDFGRQAKLALNVQLGAIFAEDNVEVPVTLLFLTGGDTSVRGYAYESIGTILSDGSTYGARYLATASVEWRRPITLFGDPLAFEHALFVDSGKASDDLSDSQLYTGIGTGLRWSSPVGPLQTDVAYGLDGGGWRIHLRIGFQF